MRPGRAPSTNAGAPFLPFKANAARRHHIPKQNHRVGIVNLVGYKARAIARQYGAERHAATWTHVSRRHTRKASVRARRY